MITVKCDYCGKRIESTNEQVNLDFNSYGVSGFPYHNLEYQFHTECAIRVKNKLEDFLKGEESEDTE